MIHQDLLAIHSGHFREWLNKCQSLQDFEFNNTPYPLKVKLSQFYFFLGWLHTGSLLDTKLFTSYDLTGKLWELGAFLEAPGFQNSVIDKVRSQYRNGKSKKYYMNKKTIKGIYGTTRSGSRPRKLASDIMGMLKVADGDDYEKKWVWAKLLKKIPGLNRDYTSAHQETWIGSPWDERYRARYMVQEEPVYDMWEQQILKKGNATLEERKADKTLEGQLEWEHLERMVRRRKLRDDGHDSDEDDEDDEDSEDDGGEEEELASG